MRHPSPGHKSKALATWIAIFGGAFGLHRFYLYGAGDGWGWMHPLPALLGLVGVQRMRQLGQDDRLAWLLIPLLGLVLSAAMLMAIIYALTPDDRWNARFNPHGPASRSGWATVIGAAVALFVGAGVLMATIAFGSQRYFESQVEPPPGVTLPAPQANKVRLTQ